MNNINPQQLHDALLNLQMQNPQLIQQAQQNPYNGYQQNSYDMGFNNQGTNYQNNSIADVIKRFGNKLGFGNNQNNMINNDNLNFDNTLNSEAMNQREVNNLRLGLNMPTFELALSGLQTLGNLWGARKSYKMMDRQFQAQQDFANTNLNNTIRNYNTKLGDIARSRGHLEGQSQEEIDRYIEENKARRG